VAPGVSWVRKAKRAAKAIGGHIKDGVDHTFNDPRTINATVNGQGEKLGRKIFEGSY
jgi:hypothetical protein